VPFRHGHRILPEGVQNVSYSRLALNMAFGLTCGLAGLAVQAPGAAAQSAEGAIGIELNSATDVEGACRLTYVVTNGTATDLTQASWEVAVFDEAGTVTRLWVLDFGSLPQTRTRVVQFDLADQPCEKVSRISVNDAVDCVSAEGPQPVCRDRQSLSSKVGAIAFN
jgi:hypothetical protein